MNVVNDMGQSPTIQLSSGRYFSFLDPSPLTIQEIAHGLSHICRFTGHCRTFYSVAEHSVLVSMLVPKSLALWGLLHDATEAVIGDVASPLKKLLPDYQALENRCEAAILEGFGLTGPIPWEVKHADRMALATEQRDLMPRNTGLWMSLNGIQASEDFYINALDPHGAKWLFIQRYEELQKETAAMAA